MNGDRRPPRGRPFAARGGGPRRGRSGARPPPGRPGRAPDLAADSSGRRARRRDPADRPGARRGSRRGRPRGAGRPGSRSCSPPPEVPGSPPCPPAGGTGRPSGWTNRCSLLADAVRPRCSPPFRKRIQVLHGMLLVGHLALISPFRFSRRRSQAAEVPNAPQIDPVPPAVVSQPTHSSLSGPPALLVEFADRALDLPQFARRPSFMPAIIHPAPQHGRPPITALDDL